MQIPGLNLGEWLRRLGVRREGWAPEMAESISAVQLVSDASALTSPLVPPSAIAGGEGTSSAAGILAVQLTCRAPGGLVIELFRAGGASTVECRAQIRSTPVALLALPSPRTPVTYNLGPEPVRSFFEVGEVAATQTSFNDIMNRFALNTSVALDTGIYLPPGLSWYWEHGIIFATTGVWTIKWRELPGRPG